MHSPFVENNKKQTTKKGKDVVSFNVKTSVISLPLSSGIPYVLYIACHKTHPIEVSVRSRGTIRRESLTGDEIWPTSKLFM